MTVQADVRIIPYDNVFVKLICDNGILREIQEQFTFEPPDAKFMARQRPGWDGRLRLVHAGRKTIYRGLAKKVAEFCEQSGYSVDVHSSLTVIQQFTASDAKNFTDALNLTKQPRPYQDEALAHCVSEGRGLLLSPTASGKSLIIYNLIRYYNGNTLLVVPNTNLCVQMQEDFTEYSKNNGWNVNQQTAIVMSGKAKTQNLLEIEFTNNETILVNDETPILRLGNTKEVKAEMLRIGESINAKWFKDSNLTTNLKISNITKHTKQVHISTWQSIYKQPKAWFDQFDVVIVDEAHGCKATSLKTIMENCKCDHRFGFTGTLDGAEINEMVLEGLFGPPKKVINTNELIQQNYVSAIDIRCIVFDYNKMSKKLLSGEYREELDFIVSHKRRNEYICKLASSLPGNTLILFQLVEKQGEIIYKLLQEANSGKKLHFISGSTTTEERNKIRHLVDNSTDNIIVASVGTTGTGANIVHLNNLILASPTKSRIRTLQSIGRGLRRSQVKTKLALFDLSDNLWTNKQLLNHTYRHFLERLRMYVTEMFPYKIHQVELEK